MLIEQIYPGESDHLAHFEYLARAFSDKRYFRIAGKPVFLIYRPISIPDLPKALEPWRNKANEYGFPGLHLVAVRIYTHVWDPVIAGFDASVTLRHPLVPPDHHRSTPREMPWVLNHPDIVHHLVEPPREGTIDYPCTGPG